MSLNTVFQNQSDKTTISTTIKSIIEKAHTPESIIAAFGGQQRLQMTLWALDSMDLSGPQSADQYLFRRVKNETAEEASQRLTTLTDSWDKGERPSFPAIAQAWLKEFGINEDSNAARTLLLTAARAEMIQGRPPASAQPANDEPAYHNRTHYLQVFQAACYLLQTQLEFSSQCPKSIEQDRLMSARPSHDDICALLISAMGHDINHTGCGNPKDPVSQQQMSFYNEDCASAAIYPLMEGVYGADAAQAPYKTVKTFIRFTDPGAAHHDLIKGLECFRSNMPVNPSDNYDICNEAVFWSHAAILADSDLLYSCGAGSKANVDNSKKLTAEAKSAGLSLDFTTAAARKYFFDNIIGVSGFLSAPARAVFNDAYQKMRSETELELKAA